MSLNQPDDFVSILSIMWNTERDTFYFKVEPIKPIEQSTKRKLRSEIARKYDLCGWLAPLFIVAKIVMQHLWKEDNHWECIII